MSTGNRNLKWISLLVFFKPKTFGFIIIFYFRDIIKKKKVKKIE